MVYCFYADRTQVFNKAHKQFFTSDFLLLSVISIALGLFTIQKPSGTADQPFLSRDQTDEWKGWMQFAILIYHYTGASKVSIIYGFIRITIASYLFLTGYGHTLYFLNKKDYSLKRVSAVLIRLNLLSCILPFMMGTNYIFYYFAPLCSYWFLVVYATMRAGEQYNSNVQFLAAKIFFAALASAVLTYFPGILEGIFTVVNFVARTEWDVKEWRFRVSLDMWIVFVGMFVAILFTKAKEGSWASTRWWGIVRRYATVGSAVALPLHFLFQMTRADKYEYNAYHPYISFIPILSFIVLRNATPQLRNAHSGVFAWLGKCSLEAFTLQFHIWMAADTKGLLDLGIFGMTGRLQNFIFAIIVLLIVSNHVAGVTGVLAEWIMGTPMKPRINVPQQQPAGLPTPRGGGNSDSVLESKEVAGFDDDEEEAVPLALRRSGETSRPRGMSLQEEQALGYWGNLKYRMVTVLVAMWFLSLVRF